MNESCPYPVGILAGHSDGITHIDPRVTKKLTLLVIDKKYSKIYLSQRYLWFNPFAPGDFAEKRVLKLFEWFSGHCRAIKS